MNRIGYRNHHGRFPGLTHTGDEREEKKFEERASKELEELKARIQKGQLVNFRDFIQQQKVRPFASPGQYPLPFALGLALTFAGLSFASAPCPFRRMEIRP